MRNNTKDETLKKNYLQKYKFLISEYELVKEKKHPKFKKVKHFYLAHNTCSQTFLKYSGRYKASDEEASSFLPGKRGLIYKIRRASEE